MPDNPNPQGKGLVPLLQGLGQHSLSEFIPPKQIEQIQMELFTSLFVLQSEFKFNPVVGESYWLYRQQGRYRLMMVAPRQWTSGFEGDFIGECVLQDDRTWTLALDEVMAENSDFMDMIRRERDKLQAALEEAESIEDALPVYEESLSFYGKILAFTLGKSLDISMQGSGIKGLSYREARGLLTAGDQKPGNKN